MGNIPKNWKLSSSGNGGLFTIIKVVGFIEGFDYIEKLKPIVLECKNKDHVSLTMNAGIVTVTLDNYDHEEQIPIEEFIETANLINKTLDI